MKVMLEGEKVSKVFGGLRALNNVDFHIRQGEILGLIGPNGSGKTTLLNCISGVYPPTSGTIKFEGKNITGLRPSIICRIGIGRTFQIVRTFNKMNVLRNVLVGLVFGRGSEKASLEVARQEAMEILEFVGLSGMENRFPTDLTIFRRKLVELARALTTKPKLLLLDEPVAGSNPTEVNQWMELIRKIQDTGITILLVEHVMRVSMSVSDRIFLLHHGEKIAEGTPKEVAENKDVIEAYLGKKYVY